MVSFFSCSGTMEVLMNARVMPSNMLLIFVFPQVPPLPKQPLQRLILVSFLGHPEKDVRCHWVSPVAKV